MPDICKMSEHDKKEWKQKSDFCFHSLRYDIINNV